MWYKNDGDFVVKDENLVYAWKWKNGNEVIFYNWAHKLPCDYKLQYNLYDANKHVSVNNKLMIIAQDSQKYVDWLLMKEDDWLIYDHTRDRSGMFPFYVESEEDFHKNYLWYDGFDEEWEWNEEGFKSFNLWAKEHNIQFARTTWDKEKHEDLLKFPIFTHRHNIVIQLILRPGDIFHYSHDKRASGEFPFSIGGE